MKTNIIVAVTAEGLHMFPDANIHFAESGYLKHLHRHLFYITLKLHVNHDNRDKEFFVVRHEVIKYLNDKYFNTNYNMLVFGSMSCEMICRELLEQFECEYVSCLEDNECGSEIFKN